MTGGARPTTSRVMMAALTAVPEVGSQSSRAMTSMASGSSMNLTRFGIRWMTVPVCGLGERGLVDEPVLLDEHVVVPVQLPAGLVAVGSGQPSFWDWRTRRAASRMRMRDASRLPVIVPLVLRSVPP